MESTPFMKVFRFILKLLLVAIVILICDRGTGAILKHYYFNQDSGELYRTTYSLDSTKADIIILGPSRAKCSYVPDIIEDSLHLTCYNAGKDGSFIFYNYAVFKEITKRYNPKLVIFDIAPDELEYRIYEYERLSILLPYYKTHPEIRPIVDMSNPFVKIKLISSIYPYNSLIFKIGMGNLEFNKKREPSKSGFVPYFAVMKNELPDTMKIKPSTIDENKINALKDIITTCKKKNIQLVFVYSPVYSIIRDSYYYPLISDYFSGYNVEYIDLSNDPVFINNPQYFSEKIHLNNDGANVFTTMVLKEIESKNIYSSDKKLR
jgi:hypothetical protein